MTFTDLLPIITLSLLLSWPLLTMTMAIIGAIPTRPTRLHGPDGTRHYWIMVPALNEAKVIRNTVTGALALHTARAPVRVLVIDDGSDDGTAEVLRQLNHPRLHVLTRRPPNARQGKGLALNAGYRMIRDWAQRTGTVDSTIVGVIDGDGRGARGMINQVVDAFFADPRVGAVQCRVRITNRRWLLGFLQDVEFACVAHAAQRFRDLVDAVGLGGNGQFVRLRDLMRFADTPWSTCLVEDLDLGIRLHLEGVRVRYASAAEVHQQAIVHPGRLIRQRARWAQGNLQCASYLTDLFRSRRVRSVGLVDFLAYLITPWLTVPMSIIVAAAVTLVVVGLATDNPMGGLVATGPFVGPAVTLWLVVLFLPGILWAVWHWYQLNDEPLWRCLVAGAFYPLFLLLGVIATWRGLARHLTGRNTWSKTARLDETHPPHGPRITQPVPGGRVRTE
jgi:1,2-diacylglycerol 3-beta-glucosyltransferase